MKNWTPAEVCIVILAATIPLCVMGVVLMRIVTHQSLSEQAGGVINNVMNIVGGGILGILGSQLLGRGKKKE